MYSHFNTVTNIFGFLYQWTHFCKKTRVHVLKCTSRIFLENEKISGDFNWSIYDSDRGLDKTETLRNSKKCWRQRLVGL